MYIALIIVCIAYFQYFIMKDIFRLFRLLLIKYYKNELHCHRSALCMRSSSSCRCHSLQQQCGTFWDRMQGHSFLKCYALGIDISNRSGDPVLSMDTIVWCRLISLGTWERPPGLVSYFPSTTWIDGTRRSTKRGRMHRPSCHSYCGLFCRERWLEPTSSDLLRP